MTGRLQTLRRADAERSGVPGEHLVALGAGIGLWLLTRRSRSPLVRTLGMVGGGALVTRAASGREGLAKVVRWLPVGRGLRR